jgi:hypothetical protein
MASTLLISPLNFCILAGAAGAGAVVAAFGGAAAMAPDTKATNVSIATNRIVFFIQFTSLLIEFRETGAKSVPKRILCKDFYVFEFIR